MASTLDNALKLLGLENADDPALLWQNYMDRLGVLQTELIRATTESRQQDLQAQLAKLVAAYQLLRSAAQLKRSYATTMVRPAPSAGVRPATPGVAAGMNAAPSTAPRPGVNTPPSGIRSMPAQTNSQTAPTVIRPRPPLPGAPAEALQAPAQPQRPVTRPLSAPPQAAAAPKPPPARSAPTPAPVAAAPNPAGRIPPTAVPSAPASTRMPPPAPRPMPAPAQAAANRPPPKPVRVERVDGNSVTPVRAEADPATSLMPPSMIRPGVLLQGRYEIETLLGDGGMGRVYAARDRLKDEDVAIKVLRNELLSSMAARGRFLSEAKVSCRLAHPNIVRVFDVGVADGRYFFTMERLNGKSLRQRMQQNQKEKAPFPLDEATAIAHQLLDALRHAHRYIVHRDLKPENVWIEDNGVVKLMDFGISRAYVQTEVTRTGISMGTAYYMAPEQLMNANNVDWRADQYAFGVLMYEMLTGRVPMGVIQSLERIRKDIPKDYARAIMRTLSPRPEQRFPSLRELQNVLISHKPVDMADAVFYVMGQAFLLGTVAGGVFGYLDSAAQSPEALAKISLIYPKSIAAGVGTILVLRFCESILRTRTATSIALFSAVSILWIGTVLFFSQHPGYSDGLVMLLTGTVGASASEAVTRRWGGSSASRYRLQAAIAGAVFGSLLGLMLLVPSAASRNLWLTALSGFVPAIIVAVAGLRRSLSVGRPMPGERAPPPVTDADGSWQDNPP
jgi:tRNA A-37 threonylcarbamoyl transferase component Bud32